MSMMRLISPLVPTLHPTDTGDRALGLMHENNLVQLPLVEEDNYLGLVQENDLLDWDITESTLSGPRLLNYKPAIISSAHPYEALRIFNQMGLSVLPVVDNESKYAGSITKDTLLKYLAENSGLDVSGGIIILEIQPHNYSLYQIARICENEDVTVLNSQVFTNAQGVMEVTLKTNRTSLEPLVSSFERHDYKVLAVYGDTKDMEDVMGKYNLLMNYINM
jgi:acetoin utilization protein AcuB